VVISKWRETPFLLHFFSLEVIHMLKQVLCPVCNGTGSIGGDKNPGQFGIKRKCINCNGKGWIEIEE